MSSKKYDLVVFIGRFQPVHIGHIAVIQTAQTLADEVLVLIGSSGQPRTSKNPWTFAERAQMIKDSVDGRIRTCPLQDSVYNDQQWATGVQNQVDPIRELIESKLQRIAKIAIIGHSKDESSYYLKMFPQWELVEHELDEVVNATDIRKLMFDEVSEKFMAGVLPKPVLECIHDFRFTTEYSLLKREYEMIKKYHKAWAAAPYAPTFVTTDAVVVQSGHILLIQRKVAPGEGLFALPGGFLDQQERLVDGMVRELREETRLKVPTPVLKGSIVKQKVFDAPNRSLRGRTITHAFHIELPPGQLPLVKGSDDARHAFWIPISDLDEEKMFEDHYHIIKDMLGAA